MSYPKFEKHINDVWAVTLNKDVGADDRGVIAIPGSSIMYVSNIPYSGCESIDELIDYAMSGSYDAIAFRLSYTFDELNITIPDNFHISVFGGESVTINLTNFTKVRRSGSDVIATINSGGIKGDTSDRYSPLTANGDTLYYIKENGDFQTVTRSNISGKTYLALAPTEFSIINNAGSIDLYGVNTLILAGLTNINITNPKIQYVELPSSGEVFIKHTDNTKINKVALSGPTQSEVTIKDNNNSDFSAEGWWVMPRVTNPETGLSLAYAFVENNYYITYIYDTPDFASTSIIKVIPAKLMTGILIADYINTTYTKYYGGSQIWKTQSGDWTLEKSLNFNPSDASFIRAGNILYFIASDTSIGRVDIYKKNYTKDNSQWEQVFTQIDKPIIYLSHYYDESTKLLRILFKDISDDQIYYFINRTINLSRESSINGITINNNASFWDLGEDDIGYNLFDDGLINDNNDNTSQVNHCTVNANDLNATNGVWEIYKTIIRSNKNGIYYRGDTDPTFGNDCKNNLIIAGDAGVRIEKKDDDTITFNSTTFKNNTIDSINGIFLCNVDSSDIFKNNIINATNYALYLIKLSDNFTMSNSIVNGKVGPNITLTSCLTSVNPLFKDPANLDYTLMSIAEGYPKDSKAIDYGDDGKDAGCYDTTRTNNGETDKETFELTGYLRDIGISWDYPQKETAFDYRSNFVKNTAYRVRVLSMLPQSGNITYKSIMLVEKLINDDNVMRFFPFGDDGIKYLIDETDADATEWVNEDDLTFNATNLTATAPTNHKFASGFLKGAWLRLDKGSSNYIYLYIDENDETTLYLENKEDETLPSNGDYTCRVLWYYVKTSDTIDYINDIWCDVNQPGKLPELNLYVVEGKDV